VNQTEATTTLRKYISARYPLIAILSHEESRVMESIKTLAKSYSQEKKVFTWSITSGLIGEGFDAGATADPIAALAEIMKWSPEDAAIFVMKDLHGVLGNRDRGFDPVMVRNLRDVSARFESSFVTVILLSPTFSIPIELEKVMTLIDWPLPDRAELNGIVSQAEAGTKYPVTLNGSREALISALRGLTAFEASGVLAAGIITTKGLGDNIIPYVVKEKRQIIEKSGVLEFYDSDVTMAEVGGLQNLKQYAAETMNAFTQEARDFGLDAPKGVMLVGIPGTGKSLAAKAIAGGRMPLVRMDVGALMGGLVGQSEANMRLALKTIEAVAPAVLWIDEAEKALGGGSGELDGGTSARVFGTLLTWMQETSAPVYVVATANDIRALKPELLRRFDDLFWVDLPNRESRIEIIQVHLAKRKQAQAQVDVSAVAEATWGFSGAEIEKVVKAGMKTAFFRHEALATQHLLAAAQGITPIAITMADQIRSLRNQAKNAQNAGDPLEEKPAPQKSRIIQED
jgi:AAA+ superfamily predicted ATPase